MCFILYQNCPAANQSVHQLNEMANHIYSLLLLSVLPNIFPLYVGHLIFSTYKIRFFGFFET